MWAFLDMLMGQQTKMWPKCPTDVTEIFQKVCFQSLIKNSPTINAKPQGTLISIAQQ